MIQNINQVTLAGTLACDFSYSHTVKDNIFYKSTIKVKRRSGVIDYIPIMANNHIQDFMSSNQTNTLSISGVIRSHNQAGKLILYILIKCVQIISSTDFESNNKIVLEGYLCKKPTYRITPTGKKIADVIVAVNRSNGKSDYIPCISWGKDALFVNCLNIGDKIYLTGRMQSRIYIKKLDELNSEERIAMELSINYLHLA